MSRTVLCLKMLELLKTNEIISKSELAKRLKTKKRNIVELRKELEEYGYKINIILGKQGGYHLVKESSSKNNEKSILAFLHDYIRKTELFPKKDECLMLLEKYIDDNNSIIHPITEFHTISYLNTAKINKYLSALFDAINESNKVKLTYLSNDGHIKSITFLPYNFCIEKGQWYCIGKQNIQNNIITEKILIPNIIKMEIKNDCFKKTIENFKTLESEQSPIVYYYLDMTIKDRWDLYFWKFGVNQKNTKINEHLFNVKCIIFEQCKINELKQLLGDYLVQISVKDNGITSF